MHTAQWLETAREWLIQHPRACQFIAVMAFVEVVVEAVAR